ncbi:adenylosuccinate lyase, putative [Brugia malayi]|uniref:Adenylosuccinate lyase n=2 Tax=Brugia TaxID=6278 RepID=A0A0I9N4H5_BRUMA|nr:adenylosuccinate lyase, putative [Brugia malayi]CTP81013.1 Bm13967 [Brugia malayi]VIO97237.1 adenylosuccinate lyase, putative [Brugia malayi]
MISHINSEDKFETVLKSRYCGKSPLMNILSERNRVLIWRQMWIWLAEGEMQLGLKQVTEEAIEEMKKSKEVIDWGTIRREEKRIKHDVMAHTYAFGKMCPKAKGIIHLGATSCFVQDNADLIVQRQATDYILKKLAVCLSRMDDFAEKTKDIVTVGRTHYQTASLVTVGKRAAMWAQELLMVFTKLEHFRENMRFRGVKGATGTQDSFMALFHNDEAKVDKLDELIMKSAGFASRFYISGQTYSRQQDCDLVNIFALLGAATKKICTDIRILQAFGEVFEPFESEQVGSSAMPYKRNPIKSERVSSLARKLMSAPQDALNTLGDQSLERTLDDSAIRRILIPDMFLLADAILTIFQHIVEGLTVDKERIEYNVHADLPFLALEKAMMLLTEEGADRQDAYEKIREVTLAAKETQKRERVDLESILANVFFDKVRDRILQLAKSPLCFTGRSSSQTIHFLNEELRPAIAKYLDDDMKTKVQLDV